MPRVNHCTEIGSGRENEDAFAVVPHPADPTFLLCVVADGHGGQPRGGPAARLACQTCIDLAAGMSPVRLRSPDGWAAILEQVDRVVAAEPTAGLTTLVGLCVMPGDVIGASNGDSAAVLACAGHPSLILTERQLKNPPIGSGVVTAVSFRAPLVRPWTLLAMTDGVWKYAGWDKVGKCAEANCSEATVEALRDAVRLRSGAYPDDFTLIVIQDGDD